MQTSFETPRAAVRAYFIAGAFALVLTACGGGGSTSVPPTELPATLSVNGPAIRQSVGGNAEFTSNATDTANTLSYQWTFGDGATSTSAKPSHAYTKPGVYTVHVTVTNEAGTKREASFVVTVSDTDIVQGKICNGTDGAGWCWQRPLPQGNNISEYFYLDDKHAWGVGNLGTIVTTSDGGTTWTAQRSGTELALLSVKFSDSNVGWIAASNGTVLRTTDGGNHWSATSIGQSDTLGSIGAVDANSAWAMGYYGSGVYVTKDAGAHWASVSYPSGATRYFPVSADDIWVIPYSYWNSAATLAHTTDSGATWTTLAVPAPAAGMSRSISDLRFTDSLHGWLLMNESGYDPSTGYYVSRQFGYRTTDAGNSWQAFDSNPDAQASSYGYFYGYSFQFVDGVTAFARSNSNGGYKRTTDGGATWQSVQLPDSMSPYGGALRAFTAQVFQATDSSGSVYVTFDAGAHWNKRPETANPSLNSVWFFSSREGVAIADNGSSVRTADGGQTWVTTTPTGYYGWRRMQFLADGSVGWVISDSGTVYRSTDKGKSWLSPVPQTSVQIYGATDFHFVDSMNGWAVSPWGSSTTATFYRSTDGGNSWQAMKGYAGAGGFQSLHFADATHGVAVGPNGVALVTSDGGASWQARSTSVSSGLRRVIFTDANTAIAVGDSGTIVRSTDQGQTWTKITSPTSNNLSDVRFLTATTGMAVGTAGTVLMTVDGGLTWAVQPTGIDRNLSSVFLRDDQTAWAVGDNGTIIVTVTGGR